MKKLLLLFSISLVILITIGVWQYFSFNDNKLHIIFCDVGQGDAILLKTPKNSYMLFDSGPDDKVVGCLGRHMPFWSHEINMALLTHPHADHLNGFLPVFQSYTIDQFITERLANKTQGYKKLITTIKNTHTKETMALAGDIFKTESVTLTFVGPTDTYLRDTSPNGYIGESGEFGSLETLITYDTFRVLLTGDSQAIELHDAESLINGKITILHVPHHGSKTGLTENILTALKPKLAVISVGAHNKYGHPTKFTLDLLQSLKIPVLRTDKSGDIEIVSDGKKWEVR